MSAREWQFDGLVGPTHNYAGLAHGNLAAQINAGAMSNPRAAALQGLEKMRFVRDLGIPQAFLPPHYRPLIPQLKRLGFEGDAATILKKTADYSIGLLSAVYSSSFMWTANAATVTPSQDTTNRKLHITPSNMTSHYHRSIEAEFSYHLLRKIFHDDSLFSVHSPLFSQAILGDEGAANHMISCRDYGEKGTHFFVYGDNPNKEYSPQTYPARQRKMASEAIVRQHGTTHPVYLQQAPQAIDQGVFHNDVIAMNTTRRMIVHEKAFLPEQQQQLRDWSSQNEWLEYREITESELSVTEAVSTYFFNSQLMQRDGAFLVIAPGESRDHPRAHMLFEQLKADALLDEVHYLDLRESMRNGGGPACLRLRVVMSEQESAGMHQGIILTDARYQALKQWVNDHYRDRFSVEDFCDPALLDELDRAYLALEEICQLPGLYSSYRAEK